MFKLFSGLQSLNIRRKYAEKMEEQAQNNLAGLEEIKKSLKDIYKNDAEDEINPAEIPF